MSGRIPEDIVEQVRLNTDITQIIGDYVKLKRRGRNMIGLCPFHQEKTPSFTVTSEKQIFHCFGCGQGGNVFTFLMEHEGISFPDAVRLLAEKSGITIPETTGKPHDREETERLFYAQTIAQELFVKTLREPKYKSVYVDYLQKTRGLKPEIIDGFGLGLAPEGYTPLIQLAQKKGLSPELLARAGLAGFSEGRKDHYDRFRQRLMFPIQNLSDKIIAFGGRALKKGELAKYVNSPETQLYTKSNVLYGLNFSKQAIRDAKAVIVVEGYFDVISLHQAGIKNVVASSGTAFTQAQARLLARFCDSAFLFFDADSAGVKAAIRSVDALYNAGLEVKVISAPAGEDPDSMARKGADTILGLINKAEKYLQFRFKSFDSHGAGLVEKNNLISELSEIAGNISKESMRAVFINEASEIIGVDPKLFTEKQFTTSASRAPEKKQASLSEDDWGARGVKMIEAELLSLLLSHPELTGHAAEKIGADNFDTPRLKELFGKLSLDFQSTGGRQAAAFIDTLEDSALKKTASFLSSTRKWEGETPRATLNDYLEKILETSEVKPSMAELKSKLKEAERAEDRELAQKLASELQQRLREADILVNDN